MTRELKNGDRVIAVWPWHDGGFEETGVFIRRFKHPFREPGHDDYASFFADERATDDDPNDSGYREIEFNCLFPLSDEGK